MRIRARSLLALTPLTLLPAAGLLALAALSACEDGSSSSSGSPNFDSGVFDAGSGQGSETGAGDAGTSDGGGGGDSSGPLGAAHFVYALGLDTTGTMSGIYGSALDPSTGAHTPLDTDAVTAGTQPLIDAGLNPVAFTSTPSGSFIYVINSGTETVTGFAVDTKSGALTPLDADAATAGIQPFPIPAGSGGGAQYIVASEKHVYVSKSSGSSVAVLDIGANGGLTPQASPLVATATQPRGMAFSPAGDLLFVVSEFPGSMSVFQVSAATGALSSRVDTPVANGGGSGPLGLVVHPTKKVVYVAGGDNGTVEALSYDATGALTSLGTAPTGAPDAGGPGTILTVAVDRAGTHLYAPNAGSPFVDSFALDPGTGALGTKASFSESVGARSATTDPSGKFLLVTGGAQLLEVLAIDASGSLAVQPGPVHGSLGSFGGPLVVLPH